MSITDTDDTDNIDDTCLDCYWAFGEHSDDCPLNPDAIHTYIVSTTICDACDIDPGVTYIASVGKVLCGSCFSSLCNCADTSAYDQWLVDRFGTSTPD